MQLWWKRRMDVPVKQFNKDPGHINTLTEKKNIKTKHKYGLDRRYKMKQSALPVIREEIKEIIKVKSNEIKRYQSRINQYQQNRTFKNSQGKFYRELNRRRKNYEMEEIPD